MTAADILRIATTVGTIQLICDVIAYWRIYSREPYERSLEQLSRAKWKRDKAQAESEQLKSETAAGSAPAAATSNKKASKTERQAKKLQRVEDDYGNAKANVARQHTSPGMFTSGLFFLLLRILGTENSGKVVAVLPFVPFNLLKRLTSRSLEFDGPFESDNSKVDDVGQACAFIFIYILTTMSVKYYVSQLFGTKAPKGAEGLMAVMESPLGKSVLKSVGVDPEELKVE